MPEVPLTREKLDEWIAKQTPWRLNDAIMLMCELDPDKSRYSIADGNSKTPELLLRAFTLIRGSLVDTSEPLNDLIPHKSPKEAARDYAVYKRTFINWAERNWGAGVEQVRMQRARCCEEPEAHQTLVKTPVLGRSAPEQDMAQQQHQTFPRTQT